MGSESLFDDEVTQEAEEATETIESADSSAADEAEAEGVEAGSDESEEEEEVEESEGEEEPEKVETKPDDSKKLITARVGDKEVEYDPEAKIQVKVNGEYVETTLQDALNGYSGTSEIHRRINEANDVRREADSLKAEFEQKLKTVSDGVKQFTDHVEKGEFVKAIDAFAAANPNLNYNNLWTGLVQELLPQIQELAAATPEQRELLVQKNNQQYTEKQMEQNKQNLQRQQEQLELQKYFVETPAKYGFTTAQVEDVWKDINEKIQKGELSDAEKAVWTSADPRKQVDLAVQELGTRQTKVALEGIIKNVSPSISEDDLAEGVGVLYALAISRSDVTEETLKKTAQRLYGNHKAGSQKSDEAVQVLDEEPTSETVASDDRVVRQTKEEEIETYLFD